MFAFRALFWFGVVCAFVPFKHFDLVSGTVTVDHAALKERIASLPRYCDDHGDVCREARGLLARAAKDGADLVAAVVQGHTAEG